MTHTFGVWIGNGGTMIGKRRINGGKRDGCHEMIIVVAR